MIKKNELLKILVIDDDEDDYFIIADYLKSFTNYNFVVDWCHSFDDGYERIKERQYAIYLIDYRLSIKTGLELIAKAIAFGCEEPLILLTGKGNPEIDMEAMKVGATDYLVKSELSTEKLERCIRYAIERSGNIKLIKEKERRFRSIFENSTDTIFTTNENGIIRQMNSAGSRLLSKEKNKLEGSNVFSFLHDEAQAATLLKQLANHKEIKDVEVEIVNAEVGIKSCLLSLSIETDDQQHVYLQGMLHDITERKKIENNVLQIEKLGAAGRFMRTLAHEVRNPLNNINLAVEQLQHDSEGNEDAIMFLEIVQRNSSRINSLITELLQSLRETSTEKKEIALSEIVDEVIEITKDKAGLRNIKLKSNYTTILDVIPADKNKMILALLNLVNNSIEAMNGEREGVIVFDIKNDDKLQLIITDNGSGMNDENRRRLFEPYYTTKRNGMGLGMVSSLNILQSHDATITVESAVGVGTKCVISFN